MQPRLDFNPSGAAATSALTKPDRQISRSQAAPRYLPTGLMSRLACLICCWISIALLSPALAAAPLAAGFEALQAADGTDKLLEVSLWYRTEAVAQDVDLGPFRLNIARSGGVAGQGLPLVVISHGNGGSSLGHHDTAAALAQAGFVVAAVTHTGDNHADQSRPLTGSKPLCHLMLQIEPPNVPNPGAKLKRSAGPGSTCNDASARSGA